MKDSKGVLGLYVDEPIGMDHPLFMVRVEARQFGLHAARAGLTLEETLAGARARVCDLFGEAPQPLVDATATTAWLAERGAQGGRDA